MKKKPTKQSYSLGDLIMAVSSYTKNNRETVAEVANLLESGRIQVRGRRKQINPPPETDLGA